MNEYSDEYYDSLKQHQQRLREMLEELQEAWLHRHRWSLAMLVMLPVYFFFGFWPAVGSGLLAFGLYATALWILYIRLKEHNKELEEIERRIDLHN